MQLRKIVAWILGCTLALVTVPLWIVLSVVLLYFKVIRRDAEMAWFDWPLFIVMSVTGGLINIATMIIVSFVQRVTGVSLLLTMPNPHLYRRRAS